MAASSQLRFSPLPQNSVGTNLRRHFPHFPPTSPAKISSPPPLRLRSTNPSLSQPIISSGSGSGFGSNNNGSSGGGRGGGGGGGGGGDDNSQPSDEPVGPIGMFLEGWRSRVSADPQFLFKVLMEQLVGVSACVLGDMASRPNFGLSELDFVFSTLVVGSILNFVLMYLLAPTSATSALTSAALPSYIFEPGAYSLSSRITTLVSKGATFAAVGFGAGLAGTAISNGLIALRKKMDPEFKTPNKPPPTLLNAATWAAHMGISSNLRYQTLNGVEFAMGKVLLPPAFKASVVVLRCLNNVLGGVSFVVLARMTGAQKSEGAKKEEELALVEAVEEKSSEPECK